ncbi:hypothetical protein Ciccas_006345 [Cichlidogyrus casuarinus]|uniref:Uncharacterized protein n=1 Tax=Cichlidogyrus casuarinus TaxID=1844966 RepID=A0ABD2Q600_9PLAT
MNDLKATNPSTIDWGISFELISQEQSICTYKQGSFSESQNLSLRLPLSGIESQLKLADKVTALQNEDEQLSFYGLPARVQHFLQEKRNISQLYDWQDECLNSPEVIAGRNLLYSLPTSGGKTLVAEILMIKTLIVNKKNALLVLPFISIVQEKVQSLSAFGLNLGFYVEEYAGTKGRLPVKKQLSQPTLYVATIEKAHLIANSLIEQGRTTDLGIVVVDEVHMLGEKGQRGSTLETFLTKILTVFHSRIVAMSATLSNLEELAFFLNAHLYVSDFRPVALTEYVKYEEILYRVDRSSKSSYFEDVIKFDRRVTNSIYASDKKKDPDQLIELVAETLCEDGACLIFCPTKAHCENTAKMLAELLPCAICGLQQQQILHKRVQLVESLRLDNLPLSSQHASLSCCPILEAVVPHGIAYHHSGLTQEERKSIEEAFSEGTLKLLCATSTLAAGVNLPARRVIIRKPYVGLDFLSWAQYQQMIGRAGRAGFDTRGESITLLMNQQDRGKFARHLLLLDEGELVPKKTLFAIQFKEGESGPCSIREAMQMQLSKLFSANLVLSSAGLTPFDSDLCTQQINAVVPVFTASQMGRASVRGGVDSDTIDTLLSDLRIAAQNLITSGPLHMLYLVAPMSHVDQMLAMGQQPNWSTLYQRYTVLQPDEQNLFKVLGFSEAYLISKTASLPIKRRRDEKPLYRLYIALILYDLLPWSSEVSPKSLIESILEVSKKYKVPRGSVQTLLTASSSLAQGLGVAVTEEYSQDASLWAFGQLLPCFACKLSHCATNELLPLMQLPAVKRSRAKMLYEAGFKSPVEIAAAMPRALVTALRPYISHKQAQLLIESARMLVAEEAESLNQEAEQLMVALNVPAHNKENAHSTPIRKKPDPDDDLFD